MKYEVKVKKIEKYLVEVEANSECEAMDKADDILDDETKKDQYHDDSECESEAFELNP